MRARYSIGIDLGTTNTAVAFVPLAGDGPSELLRIPQLESAVAFVEAATLPSFLYLPPDAPPRDADGDGAADERWVIGRLARSRAAETPGRVVHSAKSWLAHNSADRVAPFLPWGSEELDRDEKISPVQAAALLLRYVREAWNERFAAGDDAAGFDAQLVTITVPASFDTVAQRLTLDAARDAGYPQDVRLLEEPQAAFYRWLETHGPANELAGLSGTGGQPGHVLVVDIGGGTSDFSLFALTAHAGDGAPRIERIAVSEHILLGGDNIDLALAHRLEPQLAAEGEALSGRQWEYLVARCRDLKETALSTDGPQDEEFSVAIPGRGSRLIVQSNTARLTRAQIEALVLDGFFPECSAGEYPIRTRGGLRELGLPFARDAAVTRHLADFLRDRPRVDAVLFNGGSLHPRRLRERICTQIAGWQAGVAPLPLANADPDLAVASGAARFGKLVARDANRIEAGAGQAIFLQADRVADEPASVTERALVCVLPHGAPAAQQFAVTNLGLELRVNVPVRFQAYSSTRQAGQSAGDITVWNDRDFHALPPLETTLNAAAASGTLRVSLTATMSDLGRLAIACVSADSKVRGAWPLEFDLRPPSAHDSPAGKSTVTRGFADGGPGVTGDALVAAHERIRALFERPIDARDRLTATRLLASLQKLLGIPKSAWNVQLVRSLWSSLVAVMHCRAKSIDHEEAWLILAGFLLRPGFGAPLDESRIDRLWTLHDAGLAHCAKTLSIARYVLWRRIAGGLSAERQTRVLVPELPTLRERTTVPPELVRLAGALERIDRECKLELIDRFTETAAQLEREHKHNAQFFAALGSLLNRAPLYAGPETVVSPERVQRAFDVFSPLDWDGPQRLELRTFFLRAARVVDDRNLDVSRSLRGRIADKLERAGVPQAKTAPLRGYVPLERSERAGSFGESLPPGLILSA